METILDLLHRLIHSKPLDEAEQAAAHAIVDQAQHLLPAGPEPEPAEGTEPEPAKADA